MELVTSAFKIAVDERYKEIDGRKRYQIQKIIDEFKASAYKTDSLLENYNIFSRIIVNYWQETGEDLAGRIFDLLFTEWDIIPRIVLPKRMKHDYFYNPEEDY